LRAFPFQIMNLEGEWANGKLGHVEATTITQNEMSGDAHIVQDCCMSETRPIFPTLKPSRRRTNRLRLSESHPSPIGLLRHHRGDYLDTIFVHREVTAVYPGWRNAHKADGFFYFFIFCWSAPTLGTRILVFVSCGRWPTGHMVG